MNVQTLNGLSFPNNDKYHQGKQVEHQDIQPFFSLETFHQACKIDPSMFDLACTSFISQLEGISNMQVRPKGSGRRALLDSLSFILMALGCKQVKFYPHLITLIREQFFRPGLFAKHETSARNRIFNVCRNIEIELISSGGVSKFFQNNEEFLLAFQYVLEQILESSQPKNESFEIIEVIRKKFNIDCSCVQIQNSKAKGWIFGMQKRMYLFEQCNSYMIVSSSTSTQPSRSMIESTHENRYQSQKDQSQGGYQMIIEASQESTPKFKENQESIKYRKKSHKNSFGGDFDISGYKQLAKLVNKSQNDGDKDFQTREKKAFSMKYEFNEKGALQSQSQIIQNKDFNNTQNQNESVKDPQLTKTLVLMRGSNIQGNGKNENQQNKLQKGQRKKHITSSEIFKLTNKVVKQEKPDEQQSESNTNNSKNDQVESSRNTSIREIRNESQTDHNPEIGENGGIVSQTAFNLLNPSETFLKQNFKFSFSKKDQGRFIFKEIQSEYNDNEHSEQSQLEYPKELPQINKLEENGQPLRSSLTNLKSSSNSGLGLLYEGHCFRKNEKNRRSLLLQASVHPIQQEQSSQRERTQSVTQSHKDTDILQQQEEIEKKSINSYQVPQNKEQINIVNKGETNNLANANNKNFLNIMKNRKFSYLTQPISKNWVNNKQEVQQNSIIQGNQTIHQSPSYLPNNKNNCPKHFLNNKQKNRVSSKSPKIHKNSEAIGSKSKKRFQENPISFSQMIANIHQDSNISMHGLSNRSKIPQRLGLCSNVHNFLKDNILVYKQPEKWSQKQIIYHFNDRRKPQRFIITNKNYEIQERSSIRTNQAPMMESPSFYMNFSAPQPAQPQNMNVYNINVENYHYNVLSPPNNIRSTLDSVLPLSTQTQQPSSWQTLSHTSHNECQKSESKITLQTNPQQKSKSKLHFLCNLNKDKDKKNNNNKKVRNNSIEYTAISQKRNFQLFPNAKRESPLKNKKTHVQDKKSHDVKVTQRQSQSPKKQIQMQINLPLPQEGLSLLPSYLSLMNLGDSKQQHPIKQRSRQRKYTELYSPNGHTLRTQPTLSTHSKHNAQGNNHQIVSYQNTNPTTTQLIINPQCNYEPVKDKVGHFFIVTTNGNVNNVSKPVVQPVQHHFTHPHTYVPQGNVRSIF